MKQIKCTLIGVKPLLMHSDRFSDPLNPLTKAHKQLTSKRKKSDEDYEAIAKSEWRGSLYFDNDIGPYIPGVNIESCLISGAKISKLGTQIKRSVEVMDDMCKLEYAGPRDIQGLWDKAFYDARSVKVQQARLIRYRPLFKQWKCSATILFDEDTINRDEVVKCLQDGGMYCGIGDYRPKFGRFEVSINN